jgi:hypothetical protein
MGVFIAATASGAAFGALGGFVLAVSHPPETGTGDCLFIAYCGMGESPIFIAIVGLFFAAIGMVVGALLGGTIGGVAAGLMDTSPRQPAAESLPVLRATEIQIEKGATYGRIALR